jgi:hypothetical protein
MSGAFTRSESTRYFRETLPCHPPFHTGLFSLDYALSSNGAAALPFWQKPRQTI